MLTGRQSALRAFGEVVEHKPWVIAWARGVSDQAVTSEDIVGIYTSQTKKLWVERLNREKSLVEGSPLPSPIPKPPKTHNVSYPFSTSPLLQEQYRNPWGFVRIGKILEDLDSFAGNIAYEHSDDGRTDTRPPLLVTAAVDAIHLSKRLKLDEDMTMSGQVVWTGTSSMDIRMQLSQGSAEEDTSLVALFTFVAREPLTQKAMAINPVAPSSQLERQRFAERQRVADARRAARKAANALPSTGKGDGETAKWVGEQLARARARVELPALAEADTILMQDTRLQNVFTCQPQQRNMHGRVFGGFLMRRAFELAFATTHMFAGTRPTFKSVAEITFHNPVEVGDLLRLYSKVLLTAKDFQSQKGSIHVEVVAMVTRPETVISNVTNTFHFEFSVAMGPDGCKQLKKVLPATVEEANQMLKVLEDEGA